MGQGPVPCDVMIVGEAPTIHRTDLTKPFSGNAGRLLDRILMDNGVSRDTLYLTNVIHCSAPENESPSQSEIKACKEYLQKEIDEVKPKFIILLGAVALKGVLGKGASGIMDLHGNPIEKDGITYLPAFHPAAALRDPKKEAPLRADLKKFFEIIAGTWKPNTGLNLTVVKTKDQYLEMLEDLKKSPVIGFDLETTGLDPREEGAAINCLGLSRYADEELTQERQFVLPLATKDCPFENGLQARDALFEIRHAMEGKKIVTQNGKFDNRWLRTHFSVRFPITFDTMMAAHLLDENSPAGLKYLAKIHLNAPSYDISSEEKRGLGVNLEKMYEYCGYDVMYTLRLYKLQREQLFKNTDLLKLFKFLIMPAFEAFEDIEAHGVFVHKSRLEALEIELKTKLAEVDAKLEALAPGVNWNSPKQVGKILFEDWKLTPLELTKSGAPSTAEGILQRLRGQHEGIDLLLTHRELAKQVSSFIEGWKKFLGPHERLHPNFKLHGTVTGRLSCSDPNLQQVPRDKKIRTLIGAPLGWKFLECDYSQVELRIAAMISGDRTMIEIFNTPGADIHSKTASLITGKAQQDITKEERKKAKACFSGDTELLTRSGWVRFDEYSAGQEVAQYNLDTEQISFTLPLRFESQTNRELMSFSDRNIDLLVTPDHEILYLNRNTDRVEKQRADSVPRNTYLFSSGKFLQDQLKLSEVETRLLAMVAADGNIHYDKSFIRLGFTKERKIIRCRELLDIYKATYTTRVRNDGATVFRISDPQLIETIKKYLTEEKVLSWTSFMEIPAIVYLEEASYWDANLSEKFKQRYTKFGTHVKQTADIMQAMACTAGIRAILYTDTLKEGKTQGYTLTYRPDGRQTSRTHLGFTPVPGRHTVYCVQVSDENILVRRNGKVSIQGNCNFGFLYGMGAKKFQEYARDKYQTELTQEEAVRFREIFFETYPDLPKWHQRQRVLVRQYGQVRCPDGRIRHLPEIMSPDEAVRSQAERNSINSPVQGFASDMTLMAVVALHNTYGREVLNIVGTVHDAILMEIREDVAEKLLPEIKKLIEHPPLLDKLGVDVTIPIITDAKFGDWGSE